MPVMPAVPRPVVLHYTGYRDDRGGINTAIRSLSQATAFDSVLGLSAGGRQMRQPGLPVLELPALAGERIGLANLFRTRRAAGEVRAWLAGDARRIFHGHSRAGLLVALWLHHWGVARATVSVHCYGRQRWFYRWAARRLGTRLHWLTPMMKKYYGVPSGNDEWGGCIPNGLPGLPAREFRRWPGGRPLRLGGIGQLTANKRWDLILQALARLPAGAPVEYHHCGGETGTKESAEYARKIRAMAERLGLSDRVRWTDWQPSTDSFLREVDLVVVPLAREAFSYAALEALWAGVPVIACAGGGPEDIIRSGGGGWIVPADDPGAMARLIASLLDPMAWNTLQAGSAALERFRVEAVSRQWESHYRNLLQGGEGGDQTT